MLGNLVSILENVNLETIRKWISNIEDRYIEVKKSLEELDINSWPKPKSRKPSYSIDKNEIYYAALTDENIKTITQILEDILKDSGDLSDDKKNKISRSLVLLLSVFWDYEQNEPKKRKYENVLSISLLLTVASMIPNRDLYSILLALHHDTIKDSYRHKVLKRYYNGEEISKEDAKLVGLSKKELRLKSKRRRIVYDRLLNQLIARTIDLLELNDYSYWLKKDLTDEQIKELLKIKTSLGHLLVTNMEGILNYMNMVLIILKDNHYNKSLAK